MGRPARRSRRRSGNHSISRSCSPQHRDELVHDSAGHSGILVFGILAEQPPWRSGRASARREPRQASPWRLPGRHRSIGRRRAEHRCGSRPRRVRPVQPPDSRRRRPGHSSTSSRPRRADLAVDGNCGGLFRRADQPARPSSELRAARSGDHHPLLDGHRQDEAVVVVGVFADQVHPSRGGDHPTRAPAHLPLKQSHRLLHQTIRRALCVHRSPFRAKDRRANLLASTSGRSVVTATVPSR